MILVLQPTVDHSSAVLEIWLIGSPDLRCRGRSLELGNYVEAAYKRISEKYPTFAYRLARDSGLLDVSGWEDAVAAYWLVPFSEKSAIRTRLIVHLYRLALIEAAIDEHRPVELLVATDDEPIFRLVAELGRRYGLRTNRLPTGSRTSTHSSTAFKRLRSILDRPVAGVGRLGSLVSSGLRLILVRLTFFRNQWVTRRLLRGLMTGMMKDDGGSSDQLVAFYTRYPVLWEFPNGRSPRERQFGTLPDFMAKHGFNVVYPCVLSSSIVELRRHLPAVLKQAAQLRLVFVQSLLSVREFLKAYLGLSSLWDYLRWRRRARRCSITFDGYDVRELVLRDLDNDFLYDQELLLNYGRAYAMRRFCRTYRPRAVFLPFEYQPMERAVYVGAKAGSTTTAVVGTQSSVYFSWWMSYVYAEGEVSRKEWLPARYVAPLPDYVAAAGTVFKEALSRQYVPDRVLLTGAIRYPEIQLSYAPGNDGVVGLDDRNAVKILVVGSMVRNETLTLLRVSAEIARTRPDILLLLKFHYHLPLHEEWNRLAAEYGCRRFKVYESNLTALLKVADAVILPATTAVVVEAIALGCMPVVFQNNTEYTGFCPAMDIREALFLCDEISGFVDALNHCLNRTQAYWERRQAWPDALEKMFYRLDGLQNERLFEALRSRGVL